MNSQFCKWLVSIMVFFCLTLAATSVTAKKPIKEDPEPVLTQPAFAYYCIKNPNSWAVCLANADGTEPVKIFTLAKFPRLTVKPSVFQSEVTGAVLVVDEGSLYRIDYDLDAAGVLEEVRPAVQLTFNEFEPSIKSVEWHPNGENYVFTNNGRIFLSSRTDFALGDWGEPLVWDGAELASSPDWSPNGESLYYYRIIHEPDGSPSWQLRKADIGAALGNPGETVTESSCLFATNVNASDDCPFFDPDLWQLKAVSVNEAGTVMATALRTDPETGRGEGYYTYLFDEVDETVVLTDIIPYFKGIDWISESRIIGETDDDEIIEAIIGEVININVLINKNATSPDWVN